MGWVLFRRAHGAVERLQAVAGATLRYGSAATTRGSTSKWGIECVVANTHGVLHARTQRRHTQLAPGNGITAKAPEAGRPGSASGSTRRDCTTGCAGLCTQTGHQKDRATRTCAGQVALAFSQRRMSKGLKCVSAASYWHATGKQTTERSFGQRWKPYRGSGCQNWQSSPTHSTCN